MDNEQRYREALEEIAEMKSQFYVWTHRIGAGTGYSKVPDELAPWAGLIAALFKTVDHALHPEK